MRWRVGVDRSWRVDRADMRNRRPVVFGAALLLAPLLLAVGCTRKDQPRDPAPPAETPALALPVVAPMQARDRLLQDLEQQKAAAQARKAEFEAVLGGR